MGKKNKNKNKSGEAEKINVTKESLDDLFKSFKEKSKSIKKVKKEDMEPEAKKSSSIIISGSNKNV